MPLKLGIRVCSLFALSVVAALGCADRSESEAAALAPEGGDDDTVAQPPGGRDSLSLPESAQPVTRTELTSAQCAELGGEPLGTGDGSFRLGEPGEDLSSEDDCPGGRLLKGILSSTPDGNGGLCCEVPPSLTGPQCEQAGGQGLGDPGDGSSYRLGCRQGETLVGWLTACSGPLCGEGGICCATVD